MPTSSTASNCSGVLFVLFMSLFLLENDLKVPEMCSFDPCGKPPDMFQLLYCDFKPKLENKAFPLLCLHGDIIMTSTCSLLDWMGLVAAELGATLLCCVSAPNCKKQTSQKKSFVLVPGCFREAKLPLTGQSKTSSLMASGVVGVTTD